MVSVSGYKWWELPAITYSKQEVIIVRMDRWRSGGMWRCGWKDLFLNPAMTLKKKEKKKPTARLDSVVLLFIKHLSPLMTLSKYAFIWEKELCWQRKVLPHPLSCPLCIYIGLWRSNFAVTCCALSLVERKATVCMTLIIHTGHIQTFHWGKAALKADVISSEWSVYRQWTCCTHLYLVQLC